MTSSSRAGCMAPSLSAASSGASDTPFIDRAFATNVFVGATIEVEGAEIASERTDPVEVVLVSAPRQPAFRARRAEAILRNPARATELMNCPFPIEATLKQVQ